MTYKIDQSDDSIRDIFDILDYLTKILFAAKAARRFSEELEICYNRLRKAPFIYPLCLDKPLADKGLRYAPVMGYIVFYTVDEKNFVVRIHRILHGTMDYVKRLL